MTPTWTAWFGRGLGCTTEQTTRSLKALEVINIGVYAGLGLKTKVSPRGHLQGSTKYMPDDRQIVRAAKSVIRRRDT